MRYGNIRKAEFVLRKNRFICEIEIDGKKESCHVKNTGRLRELFTEGATVYVEVSDKPERKTKYDLVAVEKDGRIVNVDSFAPNLAVGEYLRKIYPDGKVVAEKTFGNSRFDFYVENGDEKGFIEVKGVTLFRDAKALFPDAPTERGIKHLSELCECVRAGYFAKVFFIIAADFSGEITFSPNLAVGNDFSEALYRASESGVEVCAFDCNVGTDFMEIKESVNVKIK